VQPDVIRPIEGGHFTDESARPKPRVCKSTKPALLGKAAVYKPRRRWMAPSGSTQRDGVRRITHGIHYESGRAFAEAPRKHRRLGYKRVIRIPTTVSMPMSRAIFAVLGWNMSESFRWPP